MDNDPLGDEVHGGASPSPAGPEEGAIDRMRDAPVGTNDPNIVGNVGPTDIPPGEDPPDLARQVGEEPLDAPPDSTRSRGKTGTAANGCPRAARTSPQGAGDNRRDRP